MVICLLTKCGGSRFIAIAIAASSAVYGFCSVLAPRVTEYVIGPLPVTMPRVSWMAPPIPTIPFLADELVAIRMPQMVFTMFVVSSVPRLIVAGSRSSHGAVTRHRIALQIYE